METEFDTTLNGCDNECHCHGEECCGNCHEGSSDDRCHDTFPIVYDEDLSPDYFDDWD